MRRWPRVPTRLVTSGRRWSNHARLTAAAGARAGLEVHLVLSGPPADPPNPGVVLDELLGATVHQAATDDRAERAALLERVVGDLRAAGRRVAVIGVGGSGVTGALGQVLRGLRASPTRSRPPGSCRTTWSCRRRPAAPRPGCWSGCARPACRRSSTASRSRRPGSCRPAIEKLVAGARRGGRSGARGPGRDRPRRRPARRRLRHRRPRRPPRRPASSPGPRASWSTRSTPRRRWPGSSRASGPARSTATGSSSGTPAARPACSNRCRPRRLTRSAYRPDRHASRSLIRPPNWRTAPA